MKKFNISVVIPTYNSEKTLKKCLNSIFSQDFPKENIEIIVVDGGSKDNTLKILTKYRVMVIAVDPKKQNVEYNKLIGIKHAKNDLILMMDHDNIFFKKDTLKKMVEPFIDDINMVGVETLKYHYNRKMTLLDRYFALFGVTDPVVYYLGKADRISYLQESLPEIYNPVEYSHYYKVVFNKKNIPTIGANGFLVKRKILLKYADLRLGKYFPIDVNVDLIKKGYNTYAFTKDSIVHIAGHGNVIHYIKRRMMFLNQFYLHDKDLSHNKSRRYILYKRSDLKKLIYFILISLTFIVPIYHSTKGFLKIKDKAWFLHPLMCMLFVFMYGYVIILHKIKTTIKI